MPYLIGLFGSAGVALVASFRKELLDLAMASIRGLAQSFRRPKGRAKNQEVAALQAENELLKLAAENERLKKELNKDA